MGVFALLRRIRRRIADKLKYAEISGQTIFYRRTAYRAAKTATIKVNRGCLEINKGWSSADPFPSLLVLSDHAKIFVEGNFRIYSGACLYVNENAALYLGSGFINHNLHLSCFEKIEIGHDVAISENVTIRDSDDHQITSSPHLKTIPVKIGNHVWIGMNVTILKGVTIGDGVIIGAGSVVSRSIPAGCLAVGAPARVIKENVTWE